MPSLHHACLLYRNFTTQNSNVPNESRVHIVGPHCFFCSCIPSVHVLKLHGINRRQDFDQPLPVPTTPRRRTRILQSRHPSRFRVNQYHSERLALFHPYRNRTHSSGREYRSSIRLSSLQKSMGEFSKMGCGDLQAMMSLRPRHPLCPNACLHWRSGKSPWRILYAAQRAVRRWKRW